jgi:hypothetical protein
MKLMIVVLACAAFAQEADERPKLKRREKPASSFQEGYTEGSLFKPNSKTMEGTLKRVECLGKSARIHIVAEGKPVAFHVLDPKLVVIKGAGGSEFEFACGAQKPRTVSVEYVDTGKMKSLYTLDFKEVPKAQP